MLFRGIIQGGPGTGKNGFLASASGLGHRIIIASFEPQCSVVTKLYAAHPEQVHIVAFEDSLNFDETSGLQRGAKGMTRFERFLYHGKAPDGTDYGKPSEWDETTVLAIDATTGLSELAEARALALNPITREGRHLWEGGKAQNEVARLIVGAHMGAHVVMLAHLQLRSPQAESGYKDETQLQKRIKRERAEIQETGYFPTVLSDGIARTFVRHFPFALLVDIDPAAKNPSKRVVYSRPIVGYQIKCPLDIPDALPIETAFATILNKLKAV